MILHSDEEDEEVAPLTCSPPPRVSESPRWASWGSSSRRRDQQDPPTSTWSPGRTHLHRRPTEGTGERKETVRFCWITWASGHMRGCLWGGALRETSTVFTALSLVFNSCYNWCCFVGPQRRQVAFLNANSCFVLFCFYSLPHLSFNILSGSWICVSNSFPDFYLMFFFLSVIQMDFSWLSFLHSLLHYAREAQDSFFVATCFNDNKRCLLLMWSQWPHQLQCHVGPHRPPELYSWTWQNVKPALSFMFCLVWSVLRLPVLTWNSTLFLCQVTPPPVGHIVPTCFPLTCVRVSVSLHPSLVVLFFFNGKFSYSFITGDLNLNFVLESYYWAFCLSLVVTELYKNIAPPFV